MDNYMHDCTALTEQLMIMWTGFQPPGEYTFHVVPTLLVSPVNPVQLVYPVQKVNLYQQITVEPPITDIPNNGHLCTMDACPSTN